MSTAVAAYLAVALVGMASDPAGARGASSQDDARERREKIELSMRVSPAVAFSPARISASAELRGEPLPDDEARLYCAAIEWDWGDGTRSEAQADCEPYEPGKSTLKRRYTAQHTYTSAGRYRIALRLKRQDRVLLATNSTVQIRPGVRDWGAH
jgi:hypothetical protein